MPVAEMQNSNDTIPESVTAAAAAALCERVRRYQPYQTSLGPERVHCGFSAVSKVRARTVQYRFKGIFACRRV